MSTENKTLTLLKCAEADLIGLIQMIDRADGNGLPRIEKDAPQHKTIKELQAEIELIERAAELNRLKDIRNYIIEKRHLFKNATDVRGEAINEVLTQIDYMVNKK